MNFRTNELRDRAQKAATAAAVIGVLAAPAFAGNGCHDSITGNCRYVGPISTVACINSGAGGYYLMTARCYQYLRTSDNFQFLTLYGAGSPTQPCIQQNDTC